MPKANPKKIKSALKLYFLPVLAWMLILAALSIFVFKHAHQQPTAHTRVMTIGAQRYQLEEVTSAADQEKGLGGRLTMDADKGMIFTFASDGDRCFWMKDMKFPLDIIWVRSDKKITKVVSNLSPNTYPKTYCSPAKYVIELNAREAIKNRLLPGGKLDF
jgi:uncharacterized membrane protein (UPF0127 family)